MIETMIRCQSKLSEEDLRQIQGLAKQCEAHDELVLKLNWDMLETRDGKGTNDFLAFNENGALIGYLALYGFGPDQIEISGMVHPDMRRQGIFSILLDKSAGEIRSLGVTNTLLICPRTSEGAQGLARKLQGAFTHSEHVMAWHPPFPSERVETEAISFRKANPDDAGMFSSIFAAGFGMPQEEVSSHFDRVIQSPFDRTYLIEVKKTPIATIRVANEPYGAMIYGFTVAPEWQGRGFGTQILRQTIKMLHDEGFTQIGLEVEATNANALRLYENNGFASERILDYYKWNVQVG